jgi:hypothetical protein
MKVYELMSILERFPAGTPVRCCLLNTSVVDVDSYDQVNREEVVLIGGDAEFTDNDGDKIGWLSTIADTSDEAV